jgi:hypothetical protein
MRQCYLKEGSANTRLPIRAKRSRQKARDEIAGFLLER